MKESCLGKQACLSLFFGGKTNKKKLTVSKLPQKDEELSSFNWYLEKQISLSPFTSYFTLIAVPIRIVVLISSLSPVWCSGSPLALLFRNNTELVFLFSVILHYLPQLLHHCPQLTVRTSHPFSRHFFFTYVVRFPFS